MSKKIIVTASAFIAVAILSSVTTSFVKDYMYESHHDDLYSKVLSVSELLDKQFLKDIDKKKLADYAAMGMTMSLDDKYTNYFTKEQFKAYTENGTGDFVGIGVTVTADKENNEIVCIYVQEDGSAFKAGIIPGDVILAIDGENYNATTMNDAVIKIRGLDKNENIENTDVTIKIRRNDEIKDIIVTRQKMHEQTVKSKMVSNDIGYIRITAFNRSADKTEKSTYDEFMESLSELQNSGMKKMIIDVRDNGGGDVEVISSILDEILPEGLIMYTEDKNGKTEERRSNAKELTFPMVVLANGNSASASELLCGALRDYNKAILIGEKTYGKGVMQRVYPFSDGSGMSVTVAKYFTPKGVCVDGVGLEPDILVPTPENLKDKAVAYYTEDEDVQLKRAIEELNK